MTQHSINLKTASVPELRSFEAMLATQLPSPERAGMLMRLHDELALREFPTLEYRDCLRQKHVDQKVASYLEVGVRWGNALALAQPGCKAVGVDPAYDIKVQLPCNPRLYATTSDDFFFEYSEQYTAFFELIFLDGLHEARQTAKDIYHALSVLKPGGEILVHDVLPISLLVTTPKQHTRFWTGNVWQAAYAFCDRSMPLKWEFIDAGPSGLLRLYDIDPAFRPSRERILQRVAQAAEMRFGDAAALLHFLRSL